MPAPTIDELLLADDGARWAALGFAISDGCCELGRVRLRFLTDAPGRGIVGWSLRDLVGVELDGLATTRSERPPPDAAPVHPNGVVAIDHIVAMSPSLDRSVRLLRDAGLDLRRIREQPTPAGAPRQAFFRLGAEILELIQEPTEAIERAGGRDHPARFWGLAVRVEDLDQTVERLGDLAGPARAAVQPGRRIATVRRSAGLAIPLALMSEPRGHRPSP
jgi:catechol 2,3-dioxygenase-like lactoylglutathione lyase family enzyme